MHLKLSQSSPLSQSQKFAYLLINGLGCGALKDQSKYETGI